MRNKLLKEELYKQLQIRGFTILSYNYTRKHRLNAYYFDKMHLKLTF